MQVKSFLNNRGPIQLAITICATFLLATAYGIVLEGRVRKFIEDSKAAEVFSDPGVAFAVMNIFLLVALIVMVLVVVWVYGVILRALFQARMAKFYLPQMYFLLSQVPVMLFAFSAKLLFPGWLSILDGGTAQKALSLSSGLLGTAIFGFLVYLSGAITAKRAWLFFLVVALVNAAVLLLSPAF